MKKDLISNFILRYFIGLIADRQAENKAKAGKCEHLKWGRWKKSIDSLGAIVQERQCLRCGWMECEATLYTYPKKTEEEIDRQIVRSVGELMDKLKDERNAKNKD